MGYDKNNLYLATDQFCNAGYLGALLIAVSKSQLAQEVASPNAVSFGPVSLGGDPIVIISSETSAFPMPAASTGTGATTTVTVKGIPIPVLSEQFLNPDDSRMQQVQVVNDYGQLEMWASLSSAVTITGDPSARDGVAWFKIDVKAKRVAQQGYVASAGQYMLYPAILHTVEGSTTMVFTITSPKLNPSSAYTVMKSGATSFGGIAIAALGAGPHLSFAFPLSGRSAGATTRQQHLTRVAITSGRRRNTFRPWLIRIPLITGGC